MVFLQLGFTYAQVVYEIHKAGYHLGKEKDKEKVKHMVYNITETNVYLLIRADRMMDGNSVQQGIQLVYGNKVKDGLQQAFYRFEQHIADSTFVPHITEPCRQAATDTCKQSGYRSF